MHRREKSNVPQPLCNHLSIKSDPCDSCAPLFKLMSRARPPVIQPCSEGCPNGGQDKRSAQNNNKEQRQQHAQQHIHTHESHSI